MTPDSHSPLAVLPLLWRSTSASCPCLLQKECNDILILIDFCEGVMIMIIEKLMHIKIQMKLSQSLSPSQVPLLYGLFFLLIKVAPTLPPWIILCLTERCCSTGVAVFIAGLCWPVSDLGVYEQRECLLFYSLSVLMRCCVPDNTACGYRDAVLMPMRGLLLLVTLLCVVESSDSVCSVSPLCWTGIPWSPKATALCFPATI